MKVSYGDELGFVPVIIVGAARSGTNALRDMLCSSKDINSWPCDEINGIWRHHNLLLGHDEIGPELATPKVKSFIREKFVKQWHAIGEPAFLLEKTCANSLRLDFVFKVLPEAKFIFIIRNGYKVVESASRRWAGQLEVNAKQYFSSKARYVPLSDYPFYASQFLYRQAQIKIFRKPHLDAWGPIPQAGFGPKGSSINFMCATQWAECVNKSDQFFANTSSANFARVKYEDFVVDPQFTFHELAEFLGANLSLQEVEGGTKNIFRKKIDEPNNQECFPDLFNTVIERHYGLGDL